jgi:hypothetical protein
VHDKRVCNRNKEGSSASGAELGHPGLQQLAVVFRLVTYDVGSADDPGIGQIGE